MLVCPSCRTANEEGTDVCETCGDSLAPGLHPMTATHRAGASVADIETPSPPQPKLWPRVTAAVAVLVAGAAFAIWLAVRPGPCDGKFSSERFAYCVTVPEGWTSQAATIGSVPVDQFVRSGEEATVVVVAFNLRPGTDLAAYASAARDRDREAGLVPGPIKSARLGEERALEWELLAPGEDTTSFRALEVVAVHESIGWTLQLDGTAPSFTRHLVALDAMLGSWAFL